MRPAMIGAWFAGHFALSGAFFWFGRPYQEHYAYWVGAEVLWWAVQMWPTTITLGADALTRSWLWHEQVVPLSTLRGVRPESKNAIELELASGARVIWGLWSWTRNTESAARQDLLGFVQGALYAAEAKAREARPDGFRACKAALARHGRSAVEWLRELSNLPVGSAPPPSVPPVASPPLALAPRGYREPALVPPEPEARTVNALPHAEATLWSVLEDSTAEPAARAGAAWVLCAAPEARARIGSVARRTASRRLRAVFENAGNGRHGALRRAMRRIQSA